MKHLHDDALVSLLVAEAERTNLDALLLTRDALERTPRGSHGASIALATAALRLIQTSDRRLRRIDDAATLDDSRRLAAQALQLAARALDVAQTATRTMAVRDASVLAPRRQKQQNVAELSSG